MAWEQIHFQKDPVSHPSPKRSIPLLNLPISKVLPLNLSARVSSEKRQPINEETYDDEDEDEAQVS